MAETENELLPEGTDNEVFNEASNDVPVEKPEIEAVVGEPSNAGERARDERGKFVAKPKDEQAEQSEEKPAETVETKGSIPSGRLKEEADKRRTAEAERDELKNRIALLERSVLQSQPQRPQAPAQTEPQKKRPDPLLDPDGAEAFDNEVREHDRQVLNFNLSCRFARLEHKEVFDEAFKAVNEAISGGDAALAAKIKMSPEPGAEIVSWYQQRNLVSETGGDLAAYKQKLLSDPEFVKQVIESAKTQALGQNGSRPNTVTKLPPSLTSVSGGSAKNSDPDDNSDQSVFKQAFG